MAPLRYAAKFDPVLSLDCARVEGVGAQSNFQGIKFCHLATLLPGMRRRHLQEELLREEGVHDVREDGALPALGPPPEESQEGGGGRRALPLLRPGSDLFRL